MQGNSYVTLDFYYIKYLLGHHKYKFDFLNINLVRGIIKVEIDSEWTAYAKKVKSPRNRIKNALQA